MTQCTILLPEIIAAQGETTTGQNTLQHQATLTLFLHCLQGIRTSNYFLNT